MAWCENPNMVPNYRPSRWALAESIAMANERRSNSNEAMFTALLGAMARRR